VFSINGFNSSVSRNSNDVSYSFISYNLIWGWATWRRSWEFYKYDLSSIPRYKIVWLLFCKFKLDLISIRSWYKHLNCVIDGELNTWDYQWIYANFVNNGLVVTPRYNLIRNIGNKEDPTNGYVDARFMDTELSKFTIFPLCHPSSIQKDKIMDRDLRINRFGNSIVLFMNIKLSQLKIKLENYFINS